MPILYNLGCKLNQYEGICLLEKFSNQKNIVIVNTCCVTREAEIKSKKRLRAAIRKFPGYKIVATGCACQLKSESFSQADEIIDNIQRNEIIRGIFPNPQRARYFLKIEDGCNEPCSFCVVPKLRKRIESKPFSVIKEEIAWARYLGFNEIVLVGANIGLYGIDISSSLIELLRTLANLPDLPRIRLSSIEPRFVNAELIGCLKDLPFCRHFHIPIQSGDDRVLAIMRRGYNHRHLIEIFDLIAANFKGFALSGDVIVGFPNEDNDAFNNTLKLIKENPFTHLHIFPYSLRQVTEAYTLGDPVSILEKKKRLWLLKELIKEKNFEFRRGMLGKVYGAIVEKKNGNTIGLTDNYVRVRISETRQERELVSLRIVKVEKELTQGEVVR
ncbi:MAG: radical SAM protein [candidate division WOR-3 bacterium]